MPRIKPRSRSASASVLPPSKRCAPSKPGPHQDDLNRVTSAARFPGASPGLRRNYLHSEDSFSEGLHTRAMVKQSSSSSQQEAKETTPPLPGTSSEPVFLPPPSADDSQEPVDAGSPIDAAEPTPQTWRMP